MKTSVMRNTLVWLLAMPAISMSQVYQKRMEEAISLGDTALQRKVLVEWRFEWPNDPDLSLAQYTFYRRKQVLAGDSTMEAHYLSEADIHLQRSIREFPHRLDMRLAYIGLLGDKHRYMEYTEQLVDLMDENDQLGDDWLWQNNNRLVDVDDFVRRYIDAYTLSLYNKKDEALYPMMDSISIRLLRTYPQHVPALLSLSINALHRRDYELAITYLSRANEIDPTNTSVLDNLGMAYERTGEREHAIAAYQAIQRYGGKQEKDYAARKVGELLNQ